MERSKIMADNEQTQLDKFKEAARDLETEDDSYRFKERLSVAMFAIPVR